MFITITPGYIQLGQISHNFFTVIYVPRSVSYSQNSFTIAIVLPLDHSSSSSWCPSSAASWKFTTPCWRQSLSPARLSPQSWSLWRRLCGSITLPTCSECLATASSASSARSCPSRLTPTRWESSSPSWRSCQLSHQCLAIRLSGSSTTTPSTIARACSFTFRRASRPSLPPPTFSSSSRGITWDKLNKNKWAKKKMKFKFFNNDWRYKKSQIHYSVANFCKVCTIINYGSQP